MPRSSSSTELRRGTWMGPLGIGLALLLAFTIPFWGDVLSWLRAQPAELVDDGAGLMIAEQRAWLAEHHAFLLQDYGIDYRVVTAAGVEDVNTFATSLFESAGVGNRSEAGRGLLLVIDPVADKVRLEVGYALEGVFPDAFIAYVEQRQMVPFFRTGRVADGVLAATEMIVTRAQRARAGAGFEAEAWVLGSGGGGATVTARLGAGPEPKSWDDTSGFAPGASPDQTLARYFSAMSARNASPELDLYNASTRTMLRGWTVTRAQMDNLVRDYRSCSAEPAIIDSAAGLAVIRYPPEERGCAPFFFERGEGGWLLDLTMMQRAIRFGRSNAWRFDLSIGHPYRFAFSDWQFDNNGFPLP